MGLVDEQHACAIIAQQSAKAETSHPGADDDDIPRFHLSSLGEAHWRGVWTICT